MIERSVITKPPYGTKDWSLDHIAHAVRDLDKTVEFYTEILGGKLIERGSLSSQLIEAAFIGFGNCEVELVAPLPNNINISKFLEKRGEGLHHVCFRVPSIVDELTRLKEAGIQLIDATPQKGLRDKLIAFIHPKSTYGTLVELCSKGG